MTTVQTRGLAAALHGIMILGGMAMVYLAIMFEAHLRSGVALLMAQNAEQLRVLSSLRENRWILQVIALGFALFTLTRAVKLRDAWAGQPKAIADARLGAFAFAGLGVIFFLSGLAAAAAPPADGQGRDTAAFLLLMGLCLAGLGLYLRAALKPASKTEVISDGTAGTPLRT